MKQNKSARLATLLTFAIVLATQFTARAGLITCGDNLNLSPSTNCTATVDADFVITTSDCTGPYLLVAMELDGDTIVFGTGIINIDLSNYLGDDIIIQVKDIPTGNACESSYHVYDGNFPTITCPRDTVGCTASLDPDDIKPVTVDDNCAVDTFFFVNGPLIQNCNFVPDDFIAKFDRTWTVRDVYGNETDCVQEIWIMRADTSMVTMPADITIDCSETPDTSLTGRPTVNGLPINNSGPCNLTAIYTDQNLLTSCGLPLILRRWVVSNDCVIPEVKIDTQIIYTEDITMPVVDCVDTLTYNTDPGLCNTDIVLPLPTVDDCSLYKVEASIPGQPFSTDLSFQNLPKGMHTATYTVTDSCGNFATCQSKIFIIDTESPVAICKNFPVVALPSNGTVSVPASTFNNGSYDNCPGPLTFTGSRDGVNFAPTVNFNCADAGDTVMVIIRVAQTPNTAPTSTCMVQVQVQDKLPPGITCPAPQTVQCTADLSDLSVFGSPFVFDACGYTLTVDSTIDISNCGTGNIIRTFTATDPSGNYNICEQEITVINSTPYNGQGIVWPQDYTLTNYCNGPAALGPGNLPAPYNFPTLPSTSCAMLATNYTDQFFDFSAPACYKIVRTWKVIDWCQYNPSNPTVGAWTHQQVIAVMDTQAPVITYCPPNTALSVGMDCGLATLDFDPVTATDCSPDLTYTNNSPFATSGADLSGNYPQGTYNLVVKVEDGCGNKSTCQVTVTVSDLKAPTPYCNTGIVAEMALMGGQGMAMVQAVQFNDNSFDNCTDQDDLVYTIRFQGDPALPTDKLFLDCDDLGVHPVEVWVTDEAGNSDFCVTSVIVQDNMDACDFMDDTLSVSVSGTVETVTGITMPEVEVAAMNTPMMDETDDLGIFEISGLQQGSAYNIAPQKDDGPLNGVTSYDLLLMTSHILGSLPFDSPYKHIAADVNRSGKVTTVDVLELRKLVLHIYTDFPNNTSWRFIPTDYVFPDPNNPFSPAFPEAVSLPGIGTADFIGVKIGDVNGNADPGFTEGASSERTSAVLPFVTEDRELAAGEEVIVPISTAAMSELTAIQFTLEFSTDDLELRGIEKGSLPGLSDDAFGRSLLSRGILTTAWFNPQPVVLDEGKTLFGLRFFAKRPGRLSELLSLTARYTEALAYRPSGEVLQPVLEFSNPHDAGVSAGFQLYQNRPNPFDDQTVISFTLPERGEATLTVHDTDGRLLKTFHSTFEKGYNEIPIHAAELPATGVLFYKLETPERTAVRKMVLMK